MRRAAASCAVYVAVVLAIGVTLSWPALSGDEETVNLLRGPDDFMRLVQVTDWFEGQGWRDTRQRRLDPPDGGDMHWSRIADLPLGATVALLTPVLGREQAVRSAVIVVPALLGGTLMALFFWLAGSLVPGKERFMTALLTLPAFIVPLAQLRPGRVDHHGLQLALVALAAGFVLRSLAAGRARSAAAAGVVAAISLVVGLETLPFVAAAALALLLAAVVRADGGRHLAAFGGALAATAPVVLLFTAPLPAWATVACDRMSFPHLAGAGACAAIGGVAMALQHVRPVERGSARHDAPPEGASQSRPDRGWGFRLVALGVAGIVATGLVVALFPQCAAGPYAELSPEIRYWLDRVSEARSLPEYFADVPGTAIGFATLPFVAALVAAVRLRRGGWTDPCRLAVLAFALSGLLVGWWQIRGLPYAAVMAAIAMLPVTQAASARAAQVPRLVTRLALRLCVPVAYTAAFILPILVQVLVRPSAEDDRPACELDAVLPALQDSRGLGRDVLTIAAPINFGAEILLRTHHRVLAAPYHRNAQGLADIRRIYAGSEDEAVATATRRGVDAIIFCPRNMGMMTYPDRKGFLIERLGDARPPDWLLPVAGEDATRLYRVEFLP